MTPHLTTLPSLCVCGDLACTIPYGLCHCGCGEKTSVSKVNLTRLGHIKGVPQRWVMGHCNRIKPKIEDLPPFEFEGVPCRSIQLTHGVSTIVNEEKYVELMSVKWWASKSRKGDFYAVCKVKGQLTGMQRIVLGLAPDDPRDGDHISGNTLDNRIQNLRPGPRIEASRNTGMYAHNTSGIKGVGWHIRHQMFAAYIRVSGVLKHLGYRNTKEEAEALRLAAEKKYFGEFARKK